MQNHFLFGEVFNTLSWDEKDWKCQKRLAGIGKHLVCNIESKVAKFVNVTFFDH
jgi:hypothetical protein